jgi:FkbM family methyltransferase
MLPDLQNTFHEIGRLPAGDQEIITNILRHYLSSNQALESILQQPANYLKKMADASFFTRKILGPYTKALLIESATGLFVTDPEDYEVGWKLRTEGVFESAQTDRLMQLINDKSRLLVVGGHIGTIAIPLSKRCAHTTIIEANPYTFELLQLNIKLNDLENYEAVNIAANDKAEQVNFMLSRTNSGGSKRKPLVDHYIYNYDHPQEISVPGFPLDEYFPNRIFDVIIMDIEGSEYFALKGMPAILQQCQALVLEFLPHHLKNISGITVDTLLSTLPAFTSLTIPSLDKCVGPSEFSGVLNYMYDNNLGDDALIFEKK